MEVGNGRLEYDEERLDIATVIVCLERDGRVTGVRTGRDVDAHERDFERDVVLIPARHAKESGGLVHRVPVIASDEPALVSTSETNRDFVGDIRLVQVDNGDVVDVARGRGSAVFLRVTLLVGLCFVLGEGYPVSHDQGEVHRGEIAIGIKRRREGHAVAVLGRCGNRDGGHDDIVGLRFQGAEVGGAVTVVIIHIAMEEDLVGGP